MQRITWSGIALHAGVLPGHPASHGCIRLTERFAIRLWHLTKRGTRVIVVRDEVRPLDITNTHLFVPKSKTVFGSPELETGSIAAKNVVTAAVTPTSLPYNDKTHEVTNHSVQESASAGLTPQKVTPISVFVSRKLGKLFVRQGITPLFDVPIRI